MTKIVDIFVPCFIDQFYPNTALNMVKILEKLGYEVHYNPNQTCCGQIAFNSGYWEQAKEFGIKFLKDFPNERYIVGGSASCISFIRNHYSKLFHNTPYHLEFKKIQKNIFEFCDFLVNVLRIVDVGAVFNHTVTYHDSCTALRDYGISLEMRLLLQNVKGLKLVEMQENDMCCGFGGMFSVNFESISTALAMRKIDNALETGAEYIVSTDVSCLMNLQAFIDKNNIPIKCIHIIDLLASDK